MRTALVTAAVLALVCGASAASGAGTKAQQATLRLVSAAPVTVAGVGFRRGETVVVTVTMRGGPSTRTVKSATGRFVVRFRRTAPCGLVFARAAGSSGSRAVARSLGGPCIEPGPDG